jgi:cbb3-type cytochrome oxidase maturation protein
VLTYFVLSGVGLLLFAIGLLGLWWALRSGQMDDLDTPAWRMLADDQAEPGPQRPPPSITPREDRPDER